MSSHKALLTPISAVDLGTLIANTEIDCSQGNVFALTLGAASITLSIINMKRGASYTLIISQDGTGGREALFGSGFDLPGTNITVDPAIGAVTIIPFVGYHNAEVNVLVQSGAAVSTASNTNAASGIVTSPTDVALTLQPGLDTAVVRAVREDLVWNTGLLNGSVFPPQTGAFIIRHPEGGDAVTTYLSGTASEPDSDLELHTYYDGAILSGGVYEHCAANKFISLSLGRSLQIDGDNSGVSFGIVFNNVYQLAVTTEGVCIGPSTPQANQDGALLLATATAPSGNPPADCFYIWLDAAAKTLNYRCSDGTIKTITAV